MRLTKSMKEEIVKQSLDFYMSKDREEALYKIMYALVTEAYLKQIPKTIKDAWEEDPKYFDSTYMGYLVPEGHTVTESPYSNGSISFRINRGVTCLPYRDNNLIVAYEKKAWDALSAYDKFVEDKQKLEVKLETALNACTTDKHVRELLPELVRFLPDENKGCLVPMSEINSLRMDLSRINPDKE